MEINKSFVTHDNIATITCAKCHKTRNLEVAKFRNKKHQLRVRCGCGNEFQVQLDFRRHYRKETNLAGTYAMLSPAFGTGNMYVLNISRSGVGFTVGFSTSGGNSMLPGQRAKISFQLDNRKKTLLEKIIIIRTVNEQYVGGEFDNKQALEKDLGFYLQP